MSNAATSGVTIRRAESADEARLVEIDVATWSPLVQPGPLAPEPVFFRPHVDPADTLVAEVGGRVVGYALIGPPTHLYRHYRLDADGIVAEAESVLTR